MAGISALENVKSPTLLLVGGWDDEVITLNREAYEHLLCSKELIIIPGATHLFTEPGTLEEVARQAAVTVLYAQAQPDPVIVDAVSDIERLTSNLSQKIWQKITLVHSVSGVVDPHAPPNDARHNAGAPDADDSEA